jgi:hypothetical protein
MRVLGFLGAVSMVRAQEYVFEEGSDGTISCKPPSKSNDVVLTEFNRKDGKKLFMAYKDDEVKSLVPSRFVPTYTYSDKSTTGAKFTTATLDLALKNISLDDEASYVCMNQNSESTQITITVTVTPTAEVQNAETLDTQVGQSLPIGSCTARDAKPKPTIVWLDNDGKIYDNALETTTDGSRAKLFTVKSELEISSVERAHHGKGFVCSIRQDGKEVQRVSVTPAVNVKWAPENTKIAAKDVYLEKSAVSLSCETSANPAPTFIWSVRDENKTIEADFQHWTISGNKISTETVALADHGTEFICVAQNDLGQTQTSQRLSITELPKTTIPPQTNEIQNGAAKGAMVYSIIGVIVVIVAVAAFILLRRILVTKKAVYKTEDKDETAESLKDEELEAGKKKEYFM